MVIHINRDKLSTLGKTCQIKNNFEKKLFLIFIFIHVFYCQYGPEATCSNYIFEQTILAVLIRFKRIIL